MVKQFRAYRIYQEGESARGRIETVKLGELEQSKVVIRAHYSSVNFKDALAGLGRGKILRKFPLIGGIDVAGVVAASQDPNFQVDDPVLITGCGLSEQFDGGYSQYVSAPPDSVVRLPSGLSLEEAMTLGTAGFTAALSLYRLEQNGQSPHLGPVVITGASGGVGSIATDLLSSQGYEVWCVSGKESAQDFLSGLGARKVMSPANLELGSRPLEDVRFAGAIDNVGGDILSGLLRHTELWGNVASVGLAGGHEWNGSVMPFILRGVSLLGISSNNCPMPLRKEIWKRLAGLWKPPHLKKIHAKTITLDELPQTFTQLLDRKIIGRVVVDLRDGN